MPYREINGVRLFYTDEGEGAYTLLLIHGLSGDSHDWSWLIPLVRSKYRVVACDLRGHGYSGVPHRFVLADFVEDMLDLIDSAGCESLVPVGHSFGGAIAAVMAVEHPSLVRALVEVDPAYALPDRVVAFWEQGRSDWLASRDDPEAAARTKPSAPAFPPTPEFLSTWHQRRTQAMAPDVIWQAYAGLADGPQRIFQATAAADAYLRRRACPVLSFHSLRGRAAWEEALFTHPASHAVEWEGSGHSLHIERPRELAYLMTTWLDSLVASAAPAATQTAAPSSAEGAR
jgi:pimeloyl-ACP methyl ester carboxylesterase